MFHHALIRSHERDEWNGMQLSFMKDERERERVGGGADDFSRTANAQVVFRAR